MCSAMLKRSETKSADGVPIPLCERVPASRHAVFSHAAEGLADIYDVQVNLAVWRRSLSASVKKNGEALLTDPRFTGERVALPTSKLGELGEALPSLARFPHLKNDIQLLAEMFTTLFELKAIGLRLTPLTSSMCPRFHVDRVPCRLIATYAGGGSEWLPHHCIDRSKLGAGSQGLSDEDSGLFPEIASIQSLAAGDVALLKGEMWEGNEGAGLVHRSPAVAPGDKRLLLTLDFN
ncbi:DUF1826 domain-containing protein [Spongiibacter taiwanensis]